VVLLGSSLGAAVALQAAPLDPRIRGVIAEAPFSSLEAVVRDRAPWFATKREVILVEGAQHRDALAGAETWRAIESWLAALPD
jgi:pimeloyl-ACP methyl ester carboxylesterase